MSGSRTCFVLLLFEFLQEPANQLLVKNKQFTTNLLEKQFKFIHRVFRHCQLLPLHHKLQLHQDQTVQKHTTSSCHTNTSLLSYPALTLCLQRRGSVFVNENAKRITERRRIKEASDFFFFLFFF